MATSPPHGEHEEAGQEVISLTRGYRPITREEWAAVVAADPQLDWLPNSQAVHLGRDTSDVQRPNVDQLRDGRSLPPTLWSADNLSCELLWENGLVRAFAPPPQAIARLVKIADHIGAHVVGLRGRQYDADGEPLPGGLWHSLYVTAAYVAAVFNTMFAGVASITLIGIVFITRPKQVMHNVHPDAWLPLMLIMIPAQVWCQVLTWRTAFTRGIPSPWEIARRLQPPRMLFRFPLCVMWTVNFLIGFAIVVSLYKPAPGKNVGWVGILIVGFVTFALTRFANVYLLLAVRAVTADNALLRRVSDWSVLVDVAIAVTGMVYYRLL